MGEDKGIQEQKDARNKGSSSKAGRTKFKGWVGEVRVMGWKALDLPRSFDGTLMGLLVKKKAASPMGGRLPKNHY